MAVCTLDVTTRAELKAAVDACVGDRLCEMTMPHWDVSRVTDMSFLFQGMSQFNVDISQWEMSQVTTAAGMFEGAAGFYRDISGWTFADNANTTGMFTGADTWLAVKSRTDGFDSNGRSTGRMGIQPVPGERTRRERTVRALHRRRDQSTPEMIPPPVSTPGATFPDRAALKAAVDNCIAVDLTGVACCSHGADCGAAGTVEMADWDVSLVTSMSELFYNKAFNADISRWEPRAHDHVRMFTSQRSTKISVHGIPRASRPCTRCSERRRVQPAPIEMGRQLGHGSWGNVLRRQRIQHHAGGLGHIQSHGFYRYFILQTHGMPGSRAAVPTPSPIAGGRARTTRATRPAAPQRRRRQLHRYPRERHVLRPHVQPGYVLEGVTSCTDRVLTEGCVYPGRHHQGRAQGGGGRVRRRSVLRGHHAPLGRLAVTDMSFLFQGKTQFNVDISQWEMSQVTDRSGYV